ncbi:ABC transporter substrate-binding protein [Streptomyces sp. NPDC049906]|uniref:ABC transporter substrate-binding protein n=1 Tax=Streptomyces sp. NPDC049906 TaxID=3155656 RepID=UPI00344293C3
MLQPHFDRTSRSRAPHFAPLRFRAVALGAILALAAVGCGGSDDTGGGKGEPSRIAFESCGERLELDRAPQRVAITTDAIADTLFDLGVGKRIVAKTRGESAPAPELRDRLADLPSLGARNPSTEAMMAAKLDLLITDQVEKVSGKQGSPTVAELKRLGIATYVVGGGCAKDLAADASGLEALDGDLRQLGRIFEVEDRAKKVADQKREELDDVRRRVADQPKRSVAKISRVAGQLYVTSGGLSNDVIERAGGKNLFAELPGQFAPISAEQIVARNPHAIIIDNFAASEAGHKESIEFLKKTFPTVDAVKEGRVLVMDAAKSGARGSTRPVEGVAETARFLHPSAFAAE